MVGVYVRGRSSGQQVAAVAESGRRGRSGSRSCHAPSSMAGRSRAGTRREGPSGGIGNRREYEGRPVPYEDSHSISGKYHQVASSLGKGWGAESTREGLGPLALSFFALPSSLLAFLCHLVVEDPNCVRNLEPDPLSSVHHIYPSYPSSM